MWLSLSLAFFEVMRLDEILQSGVLWAVFLSEAAECLHVEMQATDLGIGFRFFPEKSLVKRETSYRALCLW